MKKILFAALSVIMLAACSPKQQAPETNVEADFEAYVAAVRALADDEDSLYVDMSKKFFAAHPADSLGKVVFYQVAYYLSLNEINEMLQLATDDVKNDPRLQQMIEAKKAQEKTCVGTHYIDIEGESVCADVKAAADGLDTKLSEIVNQGKPVLVDFWASWCGPCRREIPNIAAVAQKYAGKINVVGIAVWDQLDETRKAMRELPISWPIIFSERASEPYGIEGIPHIMLIGADGTILARDLRGDDIESAVAEALK